MSKTRALGKLNLGLHVIPKRLKNNLFPVKFINCQINLFDELFFTLQQRKIEVVCNHPQLKRTTDNLVYKAAVLLKKEVNNPALGVRIILKKNIPVISGFGGGSSDAASTIRELSRLWKIELTKNQLFKLAQELGMDVFYFLEGGLCEVLGDGSIVNRLRFGMPGLILLIILPEEYKQSTGRMYEHLNTGNIGKNLEKFNRLKEAIRVKKTDDILKNIFNDFEDTVMSLYPATREIKEDLLKHGALKTLMAGSGLGTVGFYKTKENAENALKELKSRYNKIFMAKTLYV